jgi:hypothetical protein
MLKKRRELIAVTNAGSDSRYPDRAAQNVGVNRGQNKAGPFCILNAKPPVQPAVWTVF